MAGGAAFKNFTLAGITFGNSTLTYPANGVPLPAIGNFGRRKAIDFGLVSQNPDDGLLYKYDKTNHSIRIYTQGFKTGATAATSNENGALVKNSAGVEGTPRIPHTAANTTYDMGGMIELPTSIAPAATSLQLLLIGE
jgi:hypothetical protein